MDHISPLWHLGKPSCLSGCHCRRIAFKAWKVAVEMGKQRGMCLKRNPEKHTNGLFITANRNLVFWKQTHIYIYTFLKKKHIKKNMNIPRNLWFIWEMHQCQLVTVKTMSKSSCLEIFSRVVSTFKNIHRSIPLLGVLTAETKLKPSPSIMHISAWGSAEIAH